MKENKRKLSIIFILDLVVIFLMIIAYGLKNNWLTMVLITITLVFAILLAILSLSDTILKEAKNLAYTCAISFFVTCTLLFANYYYEKTTLALVMYIFSILISLFIIFITKKKVDSFVHKKGTEIKPIDDKFREVIEEFKQLTAKECYEIVVSDEQPAILDNKLGGLPYLPLDEAYPVDLTDKEMILLLQVNLKDLDLANFPKEGILEVFVAANYDYPTEYEYRYYPADLAYQTTLKTIDDSEAMVEGAHKIEFVKTINHMSINDYRFEPLFLNLFEKHYGVRFDSIFEIDEYINNNSWVEQLSKEIKSSPLTIGGYPEFCQYDWRNAESNQNECLFKLDSQGADCLELGDGGIANGFISLNDLQDKQFEKATFDWDCY